jgi:hypothetical protein
VASPVVVAAAVVDQEGAARKVVAAVPVAKVAPTTPTPSVSCVGRKGTRWCDASRCVTPLSPAPLEEHVLGHDILRD